MHSSDRLIQISNTAKQIFGGRVETFSRGKAVIGEHGHGHGELTMTGELTSHGEHGLLACLTYPFLNLMGGVQFVIIP